MTASEPARAARRAIDVCWSAAYDGGVLRNETTLFNARSD